MKIPAVSMVFGGVTLAAAPGYWVAAALGSMGGPTDDIAIFPLLALPILCHGFIVAKYGWREAAAGAAFYAAIVALLCIARSVEIGHSPGYSRWHANRSLISLACLIGCFAIGFCFCRLRRPQK